METTNETKTGFTKGEWTAKNGMVSDGNGNTVCTVNTTSRAISDNEADANAQLIATAPEMYSLLVRLEDYMRENHPHGQLHTEIFDLLNSIDN